MKGLFFGIRALGLFKDRCAQNLFGTHPLCAFIVVFNPAAKVLQNHLIDGRNVAHNLIESVIVFSPSFLSTVSAQAGRT
jgi:hypothetical protein